MPMSGNDRAIRKLLLTLNVVKSDMQIINLLLLPRFSINPWYWFEHLFSWNCFSICKQRRLSLGEFCRGTFICFFKSFFTQFKYLMLSFFCDMVILIVTVNLPVPCFVIGPRNFIRLSLKMDKLNSNFVTSFRHYIAL